MEIILGQLTTRIISFFKYFFAKRKIRAKNAAVTEKTNSAKTEQERKDAARNMADNF